MSQTAIAADVADAEQDADAVGPLGLSPGQREYLDRVHRKAIRDSAEMRKVVGKRFAAARELNGFQQTTAATLLRYASSTQLSLVECGQRAPTLHLVIEAAAIYCVSADYLLGISDDAEPDRRVRERVALVRHVDHVVTSAVEGITAMLAGRLSGLSAEGDAWRELAPAISGVIEAFGLVRSRNLDAYEEHIVGGARLDRAIAVLRDTVAKVAPDVQGIGGVYAGIEGAISSAMPYDRPRK